MKEYQVFLMDPDCVRAHIGNSLFESDALIEAIMFASDMHERDHVETCVWQPRTSGYRACHTFDDRDVPTPIPHLGEKIRLKGLSQKGKNRIRELGEQWVVFAVTDRVLFSPDKTGPWLFISPEHRNQDDKASRWIHAQHDVDFIIL